MTRHDQITSKTARYQDIKTRQELTRQDKDIKKNRSYVQLITTSNQMDALNMVLALSQAKEPRNFFLRG